MTRGSLLDRRGQILGQEFASQTTRGRFQRTSISNGEDLVIRKNSVGKVSATRRRRRRERSADQLFRVNSILNHGSAGAH
jgi:hypothetical protein